MGLKTGGAFWLVATLLPVLSHTLSPTYFISAPNVVRVGVNETIVINIFGTDEAGALDAECIPVTLSLQDSESATPATNVYDNKTVCVVKKQPKNIALQVRPQDVVPNDNPNLPQHVYLHASSSSSVLPFDETTPLLLSYKAGYTFVQTDKPIYTPNQKVFIRVISVDQQMRPSEGEVQIDVITPQGIAVKRSHVKAESGFSQEYFQFPPAPAFGNWTVVAYYGHEMKHNASVQFLVKEYVLPTFSVSITVEPGSYILPSHEEITTLIHGDYVFDKKVQGYYRIKYSLLDADGSLELIKDGIKGTLNLHGQSTHSLSLSDIIGNRDFDKFLGRRLHIQAFVVEKATGKIESANYTLLFVDSPFVFKWDKTLKYFKTNLKFEIKIDLMNCLGDPVPETKVNVTAIADTRNNRQKDLDAANKGLKVTNAKGQIAFTLNVESEITRIVVTMTTVAGGALANFEKEDSFEVLPFNTNGNEDQMLITLTTQNPLVVGVGQTTSVHLERSRGDNDVDVIFTYIVAGGKILQPKANDEVITTTVVDVDNVQDMVPSARMVAFYVNDDNQVIADSLWIDVEDKCGNPVEIEVPEENPQPGATVDITLTAKQHTKIALLAVDKAVYLLQDYHRLNKKKIFAKMASYDLGCGPGGGRDTQDIFKNAGISVLTNAQLQTQRRDDFGCGENNRRKRTIRNVANELEDQMDEYEGNDTLKLYCRRGARVIQGWTCRNRARGLANREGRQMDDPIVQALLKCCCAVSECEAEASGGLGRSGAIDPNLLPSLDLNQEKDMFERTMFHESWLYQNKLVDMGEAESKIQRMRLPHSITTWVIQAVGVAPQIHGMCVADEKEILARRDFFLDVSVPYSVMRQEQVSVLATAHNYKKGPMRVRLKMLGVDGLCSNAMPGDYVMTEERIVASNSAVSFSFIVTPLELKDFSIDIYMFSTFGNEKVRKTLHVVPEGMQEVEPLSIVIDPVGFGNHPPVVDHPSKHLTHSQYIQQSDQPNIYKQYDTVTLRLPEGVLPDSAKCEVNVVGDILGPIASAAIKGLNIGNLLQIPHYCGEQTMMLMAPNVYIYKYLKTRTGKVDHEVEEKAYKNMEDGYSREVQKFRTDDGAFKTFDHTPGNSWLTAFVLRVFCQARELIDVVSEDVICKSMGWLASVQNGDGSFNFTYKTWHGSQFMGGVDEPIPLAAFVIIALSECDCKTLNTKTTVDNAVSFLEGKLPEIMQDAHSLAIVTYALALAGSTKANESNTQLQTLAHDNPDQNTKYFGPQAQHLKPLAIETTAYALLAQVVLRRISYSYPIVLWLMQQRDHVGMWYSTQDTTVALQALTEYAEKVKSHETELKCGVTFFGDSNAKTDWNISAENALVLQSEQRDAPNKGVIDVTSTGHGKAVLSVNLRYNVISNNNDSNCPFEMTVTTNDQSPEDPVPGASINHNATMKLSIEVCAKYTGEGKTNMAIIDVGLLSGFVPVSHTLQMVKNNTQLIQAYEVSDRSVIFYAAEIPSGEGVDALCVEFEAKQASRVGNVQPVPVKIYDYYLPDRRCVKFYRPDGKSPVLETICHKESCQCAAAKCLETDIDFTNSTTRPDADDLLDLACKSIEGFAYDATIVSKERKGIFEQYTMSVVPLKTGLDDTISDHQHRQFWKSLNCERPQLKEGNHYLIIGKGGMPLKDENGDTDGFRYFIDIGFTIILLPTKPQIRPVENECIDRNACSGLDKKGAKKCRQKCFQQNRGYFKELVKTLQSGCQD